MNNFWPLAVYPFQELNLGQLDLLFDNGDELTQNKVRTEMKRRWSYFPKFAELLELISAENIIEKYELRSYISYDQFVEKYGIDPNSQ